MGFIYKPTLRQLPAVATLCIAYLLAARIGFAIDDSHQFATLIWAPSGIALAFLVLYGIELWPAVTVAAFIVNVGFLGASVPSSLGIAVGNTLEPVVGAYLLRTYFNFSPMFSHLGDSFGIILISFSTTLIASVVGVGSLVLGNELASSQFATTWFTWWMGDSLGILIVAPFLLRWLFRPFFTKTRQELIEGILLYSLLVGVSILIFWTPVAEVAGIPLVYTLFIPLIWAALRTGPRGMTLAIILTAGIALSAVSFDHSGLLDVSGGQELLVLQIFLGTLAAIFLLFVSIVEERKEAVVNLENHVLKLEEAFDRIRLADEAKSEFIATLAHELRNPLSPIVSAVELIFAQGFDDPEAPNLLKVIHTHVRTMARLLDDLLDISRINRNKFYLKKEIVELQTIINHSHETVAAFFASRKHALSFDIPREPIWLSADPVRLEQILVNLLFNAAKYTEPGGRIRLVATVIGDIVRVEILDNGIGIPEEILTKIFDPFVQGASSTGNPSAGLGIGLSLTKRFVELHGGAIWAASEGVGKGSRFTFELPTVSAPTGVAEQSNSNPVRETLSQSEDSPHHSILLVDDNESAAQGLGTLLRYAGHDVALAYDGESALNRVRERMPRVVLLDIGLPDINGYEVAQKIREQHGNGLILIALTGYGQDEDKQKAQNAGFNHHLTKPVGIADVTRILDSLR